MSIPRAITSRTPSGIADPHEVAGTLGGQERRGEAHGIEHQVALLPHAQAAERVAVEAERR